MDALVYHTMGILDAAWQLLLDASLYIVFGIVAAGLIKAFVKEEKIKKHIGKENFSSVIKASLIGLPLPLCSCGVLPTAIGLRKQGAGKSGTLSFLISTPETSVDSIALTYALIDPIMTIFRPLAGFITAMIAGVGELLFGEKENVETATVDCPTCRLETKMVSQSIAKRMATGMRFAFVDLLKDISKWFLFGILVAGIIQYVIPDYMIEKYLGSEWLSMIIMLIVGIPLYICATASTPIGAALLLKGAAPGAVLVFLIAGPATNAAGILLLTKFLGKRSVAIYLTAIAISSLGLGWVLNFVYRYFDLSVIQTVSHVHDPFPYELKLAVTIPLTIVMILMTLRSMLKSRRGS